MSAGAGFFWLSVLLISGRNTIAHTLHKQIHLGYKIHVGHQVYNSISPALILHHGKKHVFLGKAFKLRQITFLDLEHL